MKPIEIFNLQLAANSVAEIPQKTTQYGKFFNSENVQIEGTSKQKGFEKQLEIQSLHTAINDKDSVVIIVPNSIAINSFIEAKRNKTFLKSGEISVLRNGEVSSKLIEKLSLTKIKVNFVLVTNGIAIIELLPDKMSREYFKVEK